MRCIDIDYLISSYVLHRYAATLRVKSCLASLCSNVAVGCNIAISISNYVVKRSYYAIRRNFAACKQIYVSSVGSEATVGSDIIRCIDVYFVISFNVLRRYTALTRFELCFTSLCSNVAIGIDIAVSVRNYVIMSIYCAISRNFATCKQIYVSFVGSKVAASSNIFRCIDSYCPISCYFTAGCNGTLLRIDAYLISRIQVSSACCSNIAICLNSDITGMFIIILRGIDIRINGNLAGICLVVFNQDIALDMRISNSNQQIIRRTVKPGYAINHQAAARVLTLNRQALHLIALAEQLLRLAGFNCQIICSNTCSRCSLKYAAVSIQRQAVVSTVHCNAAVAKCNITIGCGNYAISASYQRAAV